MTSTARRREEHPVVTRRAPGGVRSGARGDRSRALLALLAGVAVGAIPLSPVAVVDTLTDRFTGLVGWHTGGALAGTDAAVLLQLQLPRVILAALVGAGLAISGAAYQGVFRNPLADPYLLGAAAGAGLGATLVIAYAPGQSLGRGIVPLAAFVGALVGVGCALALGTAAGGSQSAACCSPASRSRPSSPRRRPWCSSRTPTTCGPSTAGCSGSWAARSGPTSRWCCPT